MVDGGSFVVVRIVLHLWMPVAHRGAKCLSSVLEKWSYLQFCRTSLSYSFVPCGVVIVCLLSLRMVSVACEAARRPVAISFSMCSGGRLSIARP